MASVANRGIVPASVPGRPAAPVVASGAPDPRTAGLRDERATHWGDFLVPGCYVMEVFAVKLINSFRAGPIAFLECVVRESSVNPANAQSKSGKTFIPQALGAKVSISFRLTAAPGMPNYGRMDLSSAFKSLMTDDELALYDGEDIDKSNDFVDNRIFQSADGRRPSVFAGRMVRVNARNHVTKKQEDFTKVAFDSVGD